MSRDSKKKKCIMQFTVSSRTFLILSHLRITSEFGGVPKGTARERERDGVVTVACFFSMRRCQ